jgi:replicative DNA helicase
MIDEVKVSIDLAGEQVVIAAAIVSEDKRPGLVRRLTPEQFQHPAHRAAWEAMAELSKRGLAYDPATVRSLFGERVDVAYLEQLAGNNPTPAVDLDHFVDRVLWDSARANATRGPLPALLEALRDQHASPEKVRILGKQLAEALGEWRDRRHLRDPSAVVRELVEELEERRSGRAIYPYGVPALDVDEAGNPRLTPGAKPGHVTLITAVSGAGKSTLACRVALGLARQRKRVLYGAWEMSRTESCELLAVMSLSEQGVVVSRAKLMAGQFDDELLGKIKERAGQIGAFVRFFDNPFGLERGEKSDQHANDRNLDLVHQMISDTGSDVFIADLFERCLGEVEEWAERRALWRVKAIAQATSCHVILLAQQRLKSVEQRVDTHPTREGVKGSSAWIDITDTGIGVHRPAQWKDDPDEVVEIDVLKRRFGRWPIRIEVPWDPDRGWFGAGTTVRYERPGTARAMTEQGENLDKMLDAARPKGKGR